MKRYSVLLLAVIASAAAYGYEATVVSTAGKVEVREADGAAWSPVEAGAVLNPGATISTGFNAGAEVRIGESTMTVEALTRVAIDQLREEGTEQRASLGLPVGRVRVEVRSSENRQTVFEVRSPIAVAAVRGTTFSFDGANLSVEEGVVVLVNRYNESVEVGGGEQSSAATEAPPAPPADAAEEGSTVTVTLGEESAPPEVTNDSGGLTISWQIED